MTLQELLLSCDFKEIAPLIVKNYDHENMLANYKMAFDILRNLKAEENPDNPCKVIKIEEINDKSLKQRYISVSNCEGDLWESNLAKEIVVADGLKLSKNEIAAHCLWSITFYGFNPDDREVYIGSLGKIDERFPSRKKRIERIIETLTLNTDFFSKEELQYLFKSEFISEYKYKSHSFDTKYRIDYLIDLISNYERADFSIYKEFILMIRYSSDFPLKVSELEIFMNFLHQLLPKFAKIKFGHGKDEKLREEISVFLVGIC